MLIVLLLGLQLLQGSAVLANSARHRLHWHPDAEATTRQQADKDSLDLVISAYRLSRDVLQERWEQAWHEGLPCQEAKLKGLTKKTGFGSQSPTLTLRSQDNAPLVKENLPVFSPCQVCLCPEPRPVLGPKDPHTCPDQPY